MLIFVASLLASVTAFVVVGSPAQATFGDEGPANLPTGATMSFAGLGAGKCVDIQPENGSYATTGLRMWQQPCNSSGTQKWKIWSAGSGPAPGPGQSCSNRFCRIAHYYQFENQTSGQCLDVRGGVSADGTAIQQWLCVGNRNMLWAAYDGETAGSYRLVNVQTGRCLDVTDNSYEDGTLLQLFHCTSLNEAQRFFLL
jgi:hypothetical protein